MTFKRQAQGQDTVPLLWRCGFPRIARMMLVLTGMRDNCQKYQNRALSEERHVFRAVLKATPESDSAKRQFFAWRFGMSFEVRESLMEAR
jgi:hypothetical protein